MLSGHIREAAIIQASSLMSAAAAAAAGKLADPHLKEQDRLNMPLMLYIHAYYGDMNVCFCFVSNMIAY